MKFLKGNFKTYVTCMLVDTHKSHILKIARILISKNRLEINTYMEIPR